MKLFNLVDSVVNIFKSIFNIAINGKLPKKKPGPLTISQMVGMDVTRVERSDIDTVLSFAGSDDFVYQIRLTAPVWQGAKIIKVVSLGGGNVHAVSFSNGSEIVIPSQKVSDLQVSK